MLIRCYQGETLGERRRGDHTVGEVLGEGCGQGHGPGAHAAVHRQDHKLRFHLRRNESRLMSNWFRAFCSKQASSSSDMSEIASPSASFRALSIGRSPGLP